MKGMKIKVEPIENKLIPQGKEPVKKVVKMKMKKKMKPEDMEEMKEEKIKTIKKSALPKMKVR